MNVLTDNEKGLLVIEHLGPKALTHGTMSLLEAFELGLKVAEQEVIKRLAAGVSVDPLPAMKWQHNMYTLDQLSTAIAAARVQMNERCTKLVEDFPHWLGNTGRSEIAKALRALLGKEAQS